MLPELGEDDRFGVVNEHDDDEDVFDHYLDHDDDGPQDCGDGDEPPDPFLTDAEADADVLRMAGFGTDEDYAGYGYDEGGGYED